MSAGSAAPFPAPTPSTPSPSKATRTQVRAYADRFALLTITLATSPTVFFRPSKTKEMVFGCSHLEIRALIMLERRQAKIDPTHALPSTIARAHNPGDITNGQITASLNPKIRLSHIAQPGTWRLLCSNSVVRHPACRACGELPRCVCAVAPTSSELGVRCNGMSMEVLGEAEEILPDERLACWPLAAATSSLW